MAATHTTNLGLNKPDRQDYVSVVTDINDNMDILDSKIGAVPSGETVEGQIGAKVPTTRKINNKALSSDVTIMGSDIPMNSLDNTKLDVAVGDLKSAFDRVSESGNKFDSTKITPDTRLSNIGGLIDPASGFFTSDYIPVVPGVYCVKNSPVLNTYHRACIYDVNKNFISPSIDNTNTFVIPSGGAFVRFSGVSTEVSTTTFYISSAIDFFARTDIELLFKDVKAESLIIPFSDKKSETKNDVTIEWLDDHRVYIHGTSSADTITNLVYTRDGAFANGKTVSECEPFVFLTKANGISLDVSTIRVEYLVTDADHSSWYDTKYLNNDTIISGTGLTGIFFRIFIKSGTVVDGTLDLYLFNNINNLISFVQKGFIKSEENSPGDYNLLDFDDMLGNHVWLIGSDYTYDNKPTGFNIGFLITLNAGRWQLQLAYAFNGAEMWKRKGNSTGTTWEDWQKITGVVNNYTNEYSFPEYTNTYNVSVSPTITTDTNAYLAPSGDTSDRTAEIVAMLQTYGVCRLGKGDYYVNNLDMPLRTMITGAGYATRIILSGSSDGYAIKMNNFCTVENVRISGSTTGVTPSQTVGNRHGILWQGTYASDETPANQPQMGIISNVYFMNFAGGAITCYNTGYGTFNHLEVNNVYCQYCDVGINIPYWSEFHKFTNVRTYTCYYGCINNGGNNTFVNCDFSACKVAFLMDNSTGQSPNNSHGQCVGCVFNHTDNNTGIGIKVLNCDNGFIFDACQIFYSQIYIDNSEGVIVSNSNFGSTNCDITVDGGGAILFANNMHASAPTITITDNQNVHFVNCYNRTTGATIEPS